MSGFGPAEFTIGLPDLVGAKQRLIVGAVMFGDEQLATAPDQQMPAPVALGHDARSRAPARIAKTPDGNR
jgi:hypothetical protein